MKKMTIIQRMDRAFSRVTGRRHQYCIKLVWRNKGQHPSIQPSTWVAIPSVQWRPHGDELCREMRKHLGPQFIRLLREAGVPICNGRISIDSLTYIGRH